MNINFHNYEDYFILYMDNELNSDDRRQVEEFVQNNPDLREELDILLQYKLVPDTHIVFKGKEELMKLAGNSPVTPANYEEWLVLYLDNELTGEQRITIEQFINNHPKVKEEWDILLRTKLQPEEIAFTNKESLYRREEKTPVFSIRRWRIAAAAVLLLAIGLTGVIVLNKKSFRDKNEIAKLPGNNQKTNPENSVIIKKEENKPAPLPVISNGVHIAIAFTSEESNDKIAVTHKNIAVNEKLSSQVTGQKNNMEGPVIAENNQPPSNHLPQPVTTSDLNNNAANNPTASIAILNEITLPPDSKINPVTIHTTEPSYAVSKSSDNPDALYQSDGKKGKLRGFFRKLTRAFEKTTNIDATDEDRVLIGGLAIKLK